MSKLYFVGNNKPVTESDFIELLKQYKAEEASDELRQEIWKAAKRSGNYE